MSSTDEEKNIECIIECRGEWKNLIPEMKETLSQGMANRIGKCVNTEDPVDTFVVFMELLDDRDVLRTFDTETPLPFRADEGEECYFGLGGWLGDYMEFSKHNEIPSSFHFWSGVSILGAACRRRLWLSVGNDDVLPNWYVVLVAGQGTGKSVAMKQARQILRRMNHILGEDTTGQVAREAVNIVPSDITSAALVSKMVNVVHSNVIDGKLDTWTNDAAAFLMLDELSNFLGHAKFGAGGVIPMLTELKMSEVYHKATKGSGEEKLTNPCLSMLSGSSIDWFRSTITQDTMGGGFMDRSQFIYRNKTSRVYPTALPFDPIAAHRLARGLAGIAKRLGPLSRMRETPDARRWREELYQKMNSEHEDLTKSVHRTQYDMQQLGMMLALSRGEILHVDACDYEVANSILTPEKKYRQLFVAGVQEHVDTKNTDEVLAFVLDRGCVSTSEISRRFRRTVKRGATAEILADLLGTEELVKHSKVSGKVGGRPSARYSGQGHSCEDCD